MLRASNTERHLTNKRKTPSLSSVDNLRKVKHQKMFEGKKIPHIISQLEQNLILLKKYYYEDKVSQKSANLFKSALKRPIRSASSHSKHKVKKVSQDHAEEQITTTIAEIDDLKKSFLTMHGYDTNNIVELYNFYKKNLQKSTRLFGSTSMSNMINLTQNQSEIREKCPRPNSAFIVLNQEVPKQKQDKQKMIKEVDQKIDKNKLPQIQGDSLKKSTEMVSVATLLAEKKKISRKNICENMNSEHLFNQAKKKLYRPHPNENIERFSKLKENLRNENIRISPSRKLKNVEGIKQRSSSKKSNRKDNKQQQVNNSQNQINYFDKIITFPDDRLSRLQRNIEKEETIVIANVLTQQRHEKEEDFKNIVSPVPNERQQQLKSAKSIKSMKSPSSIRSPSLNQAVLLDITISGDPSSSKRHPTYFVPKVHPNNLNDSLLDCEITPKEQSKIIDLESIPFDF